LIPIDLVCWKEYGFAGDLQVGKSLGMCAIFKGKLKVSPGEVLQSLFLRQIQLLRESALAHFKSATTSEEMPSDFAFSTAHTLSSRATDESKRPGSGWSYNKESTDPQNTTQEIATQRKRILSSQVGTAQQHANATRRRPRVPTEAVRRGQRKGVPNDPGEHDAAVRRDVPGELRLAAAVAGLAVLEAAAKSIAGVLEMVGA
jgi:hypothetical protein